jgi:transposase
VYEDVTVNVIYASPPIRPGDWWYIDNGLPIPPPEPTPAERAWAILEPHLSVTALYRPRPA